MKFKSGDKVVRIKSDWDVVRVGGVYIVRYQETDGVYLSDLQGKVLVGCYDPAYFQLLVEVSATPVTPNYAAAFNTWMDDYVNNPQAYENSHESAVRHLKEKLNGEEPSYGEVCAEVLVNYINKLENK
jgi:hypothetical protein